MPVERAWHFNQTDPVNTSHGMARRTVQTPQDHVFAVGKFRISPWSYHAFAVGLYPLSSVE